MSTPFTVLLRRPGAGFDRTYMAHVWAMSPETAVEFAQYEAYEADNGEPFHPDAASPYDEEPIDYTPVFVTRGHHTNLTPETP